MNSIHFHRILVVFLDRISYALSFSMIYKVYNYSYTECQVIYYEYVSLVNFMWDLNFIPENLRLVLVLYQLNSVIGFFLGMQTFPGIMILIRMDIAECNFDILLDRVLNSQVWHNQTVVFIVCNRNRQLGMTWEPCCVTHTLLHLVQAFREISRSGFTLTPYRHFSNNLFKRLHLSTQ
jgi:hypothetical protein